MIENYKKWTLGAIFAAVAIIIIIAVNTSEYDTGPVREAPQRPSGPIMESGKGGKPETMPDDPVSLAVMGDRYFENNMYEQAIDLYTRALAHKPDDVDTYNDLGLAYHYTGRSEKAVDILRKGTGVKPSYQRIWLSLGYVLLSSDRSDEAEKALKKAVKLGPDSDVAKEAERLLGLIK